MMADPHAQEKRWVFSFDFKEESKAECLTATSIVKTSSKALCQHSVELVH